MSQQFFTVYKRRSWGSKTSLMVIRYTGTELLVKRQLKPEGSMLFRVDSPIGATAAFGGMRGASGPGNGRPSTACRDREACATICKLWPFAAASGLAGDSG